jgi:plastocyanin
MRTLVILALLSSLAHAQPRKPAAPAGSIKGTVIFEGEPPERATLRRDTDPYCAKTPRDAEDVIVTKGKLKDVVVRIKNGTMGKHTAPATPAFIDQKDCMYSPRVLGVVAGQKLAVRNSDGTFHNVHGLVAGKNLWNKPHAPKAPDLTLDSTPTAGDVIDVTCDVHAWMHSYAVVHDHPYFAVTPENGTFEITGLAPGSYTLEAWHPTLGEKSMTVKIGTGGRAKVTARFSYKP